MQRSRLSVFVLLALILALGLILAQQDDEEAIEDLRQEWEDLFNEGDIEALAELYTEDGTIYDAFGQVHEGRDAIQEHLQGTIDAGFAEVSTETIEAEVVNDTAYSISRLMFATDAGESTEFYSMGILRRENGDWRIHRLIANMVLPEEMMSQMMGEGQAATTPTQETEEAEETETEVQRATQETEETEETEEPETEEPETEVQRATVEVAQHDTYGEYLTDGEGRALYLFLNDEQGESVCYDQCAQNWPPLLTSEDAEAGEGVDSNLLGTTERQDGSLQVTYNDWPLYYFAADANPGDVNGQGRGEVWYLVSPEGEAIEEEE